MESLKQIKIVPTSVKVADSLRNAILTHEFKKDDIINLNTVAAKLGVSNTPVREALQLLAQDGLVVLRPNKGAVVVGMTRKRVQDHFEVRLLLEPAAARKACRAKDLKPVAAAFAEEDAAVAREEFYRYPDCNRSFHGAIWTAADNEKMRALMASLWNATSRSIHSSERDYVLLAHEEHRPVAEAILRRDGEQAEESMRKHLLRSMQDVLTHYEDE